MFQMQWQVFTYVCYHDYKSRYANILLTFAVWSVRLVFIGFHIGCERTFRW